MRSSSLRAILLVAVIFIALAPSSLHEPQGRCDPFLGEMVHEFTNMVTAVIGYSEPALPAIEDSHPAQEWLEKIRNQTRHRTGLVNKLMVLKQKPRCGERA